MCMATFCEVPGFPRNTFSSILGCKEHGDILLVEFQLCHENQLLLHLATILWSCSFPKEKQHQLHFGSVPEMGMAILLWSSTYCQEKQLQLQICWAMCLLCTWQHSCGALASPPRNKKNRCSCVWMSGEHDDIFSEVHPAHSSSCSCFRESFFN